MKSAIAITTELDDVQAAADELLENIQSRLSLQKNSCGLLYYDYDMDGDRLSAALHEALGIDILGCSTIATLDGRGGYHEMSAMLTILTSDDCEFQIGMTNALDDANAKAEIGRAFAQTKARCAMDPALGFVFFPCGTDIIFDKHIADLSEMFGHLPIVGGIPSSPGSTEKSVVWNGKYYLNMAAMLLVAGDAHPVITLSNVVSRVGDRCDRITRAQGTTIYEVDGKPFVEYMESCGIDLKSVPPEEIHILFHKYPLLIESANKEFGDVPYVRMLDHINWEDGSGTAFAGIPEGAFVSLAGLSREDVRQTVENGLRELFAKMKESGREFSTVIGVTCAGRHNTLNPNFEDEGNIIKSMMPEHINFSGFYSFGELCPIGFSGGRANNQLHNASIAFCAL